MVYWKNYWGPGVTENVQLKGAAEVSGEYTRGTSKVLHRSAILYMW